MPPQPAPARRRTRRHAWLRTGGLAVAVLITLALADQGARWWAEHQAVERADTRLASAGVEVTAVRIGGWPFVAVATGLLAEPTTLDLRVPYTAFADRVPVPEGVETPTWSDQDGLLTASTQVTFRGRQVPVDIGWTVSTDEGDLVLTPSTVTVAGFSVGTGLAAKALGDRAEALRTERRLDPGRLLPSAAERVTRLVAVQVRPDGLALTLTTG
ncbi:MAG: hypothetical protein L6367_06125 [Cellulomonas sp.]|nr:hypothetical protein [Cellulomonas sp.]